ncbi:MAG: hypothetical protein ACR2MT_12665 [Aurantibacter sp.]
MEPTIKKALQSIIAIILTMAMQLPAAVKISHALYDHVDIDCNDYGSLHMHETEFDCEFHKYNLSTNCVVPGFQSKTQEFLVVEERNFSTYSFLSKYQKLQFSLRGPPSFHS